MRPQRCVERKDHSTIRSYLMSAPSPADTRVGRDGGKDT
ncbi:hypothetical protein CaCOL14_011393 [Colletotrichum acutatum]